MSAVVNGVAKNCSRKLEFHLFLFEMQLVLMTLIFDGFELVEVNAADVFEVRPELIARLFQSCEVVLKCG